MDKIVINTEKFQVTDECSAYFKGEVMVTDPCYFLDDIWDDLCNTWFDKNTRIFDSVCTLYYKGCKILISRTAYGDGGYHVDDVAGEFGVDAGLMAVVLVSELEAAGLKRIRQGLAVYTDIDGVVEADGQGRFIGALSVNTRDEEDQDDFCPHCGHSLR